MRSVRGRSRTCKLPNIERACEEMDHRMFLDYLADPPVWELVIFRRLYRMRKSLFLTIMERVCARNRYFVQSTDGTELLHIFLRQKIIGGYTCLL